MPVVSAESEDACPVAAPANQNVELGTINYVNLDGSHGNMDAALSEAQRTGKPIFANFVEFPG